MPRFIVRSVLAGNQRMLKMRLLRRTEKKRYFTALFPLTEEMQEEFEWWSKINMCTYGSGAGNLVILDVE